MNRGEERDSREYVRERVARVPGPVLVLAGIADAWQLTESELATLLAYEDEASVGDLLRGALPLGGHDREDRLRHLFWIHEVLDQLFQNPSAEGIWLRAPLKEFGNVSPLDHMLQGSMENIVSVRYFLDQIAGR